MKIEKARIESIRLNEANPRTIKDDRYAALLASIRDFPEMLKIRPIVVNEKMEVLGGNMRLRACIEAGMDTVYIIRASELSEEQQRRFIVVDNVGFGEWNWDVLANEWDAESVADWGLDIPDFEMKGSATEEEATEDDYEIPETIKTDIVRGDLFEIGPHRLLCGDSTNADDVARLMGGATADMVFTDPPYGVDYSGGIQFTNNGVKKEQRRRLENDSGEKIYEDFLPLIPTITNGPVYTWFAGTRAEAIYRVVSEIGEIHALLIWVKNGGYGALNACYKQRHEPCLFWKPKGGRLNFVGSTTENTVWEIDKDGINAFHPTQKPVALAAKAIANHSGDTICDPFLGSGTTMVAAHQLNRRCYGMEIDEKYCQVIVDRMLKLDPTLEIKRNGVPYKSTQIVSA